MTTILLDLTELARVSEAGWSATHRSDPDTGERIAGTSDGLGFGVDASWCDPAEVIPWSEIEAIARAVPDGVREDLGESRFRGGAHQPAYPRFTASADAVGCGPIVPGRPLTPRQEAHSRELKAFEGSGVLPAWERQRAELDMERLGLHVQELDAGAVTKAVDLLEFVEDQRNEHVENAVRALHGLFDDGQVRADYAASPDILGLGHAHPR